MPDAYLVMDRICAYVLKGTLRALLTSLERMYVTDGGLREFETHGADASLMNCRANLATQARHEVIYGRSFFLMLCMRIRLSICLASPPLFGGGSVAIFLHTLLQFLFFGSIQSPTSRGHLLPSVTHGSILCHISLRHSLPSLHPPWQI